MTRQQIVILLLGAGALYFLYSYGRIFSSQGSNIQPMTYMNPGESLPRSQSTIMLGKEVIEWLH